VNDPVQAVEPAVSRDLGASDSRPGALSFRSISKAFPGVQALSDVTLDIRPGEVHAIVGENGAGKSTLMSIASGAQRADAGEIRINGAELTHASPSLARNLGLAIVRQEPALMPDLSVAENLAVGVSRSRRPRWGRIRPWATERLDVWAGTRKLDSRTPARSLDPAARFMVEISKAICQDPRVLLLDEPTESLGVDEIEILFARVRELASTGTAVVYISHRIPDVLRISDRISILRDGILHGTFLTSEVTEDQIVQGIVGTPLELAFPEKRGVASAQTEQVLRVSGFHGDHFGDLDFEAHRGEIVGISGVEGNGQRETIRALAGLVPSKGAVLIDGQPVRLTNAGSAEAAGLAYLPADRKNEGILPSLSVRENITATTVSRVARLGFISPRREYERAKASAEQLDVKTPSLETHIDSLSGGNQQKTAFARALLSKPRVILAHEPTQGVDVGARLEIYKLLRAAVDDGATAVVVSSDAAELEGLCDRVLVMSRGTIARELHGDEVTEHGMTQVALTATVARKAEAVSAGESRVRRFLSGDLAPAAIVMTAAVLLGAFTALQNDRYLSVGTFSSLFTMFAVLGFAAMAQQVIMITGGIDLSVGPLMTFLLVMGSFILVPDQAPILLLLGLVLLLLIAGMVGVFNWVPSLFGVPSFLVTLVTFTALQGLSFLLRPTYGGSFDGGLLLLLKSSIGWLPWAAVAAVAVGVGLEFALRRTAWGAQLRAIGSGERAAHDVGIRVRWVRLGAHLTASILVFLAALLLMAQVGSGDATVGSTYTLAGITAAVLGGASIFGGRGAFIGALAGALLLQQITTTTVFLGIGNAWQFFLLGGLTLAAAGFYSKVRGGRSRG
jgi:ribose transport system ATP-binding protein